MSKSVLDTSTTTKTSITNIPNQDNANTQPVENKPQRKVADELKNVRITNRSKIKKVEVSVPNSTIRFNPEGIKNDKQKVLKILSDLEEDMNTTFTAMGVLDYEWSGESATHCMEAYIKIDDYFRLQIKKMIQNECALYGFVGEIMNNAEEENSVLAQNFK